MRGALLLLAATALALTGCAGADDGPPASAPSIDGEWLLESGSDAEGDFAPGLTPVTLVLSRGAVAGQAPCNSYSGEVAVSAGPGAASAVEFAPIARTEIACADDTATALETRYLAALQAATSAETGGGILTLTSPDATLRYATAPTQSID